MKTDKITPSKKSNAAATLNATQPKRRRQPVEVKERILDAALEAFATSGYGGASVRSIATAADVSISLLIHHFKSKELLWKTVMSHIFERTPGTVSVAPHPKHASSSDRLREQISRTVHLFADFPALHRLMTLEGHELTDRLVWLCDTYIKHEYKAMCKLISEAQKEGTVVEADPARLRLAITAIAAVPFSVSEEYKYLTKKNPFTQKEIDASIRLINQMVFKADAVESEIT